MTMLYKALQYLITGVVEEPQHVAIDRIETATVDLFYLSSPKGELGRLLGRQGRTVEAMRDVLAGIARKLEKEAIIDVIEQRLEIATASEGQADRRQRPPRHDPRRDGRGGRPQHQRRRGGGGRGPRPPQGPPPQQGQGQGSPPRPAPPSQGRRPHGGGNQRPPRDRNNTPPKGPSS